MKNRYFVINALIALSLIISKNALCTPKLLALDGDYLGQKPPGLTPKAFAPGVISTPDYEYGGVFMPKMDEFYFIRGAKDNKKQKFVTYKKKGNRWYEAAISRRLGQPAISPNGKTMHLGRHYLTRINNAWSNRKTLGAPFKDLSIMRLTSSANGTLYFDTWDEKNKQFPIRYSRQVNGQYEPPRVLSKEINTGKQLNHPYIAPDESYLIWDAIREDGYGDSDLYISYRQQDGSWGKAINLGNKINTSAWDAAGYVTPDGKYFFFHRMISSSVDDGLPNVDIYWVQAQFIENLRPRK